MIRNVSKVNIIPLDRDCNDSYTKRKADKGYNEGNALTL